MISLESYRAKIGSFVTKARHIQRSSHFFGLNRRRSNIFGDTPNYFCVNGQYATKYFLRALGVVILVLILTLNLNFSVLKLLKLLTDGDVESNPGPTFKILKVIHKGLFTKVTQNLAILLGYNVPVNSLYALCWSVIKRVSVWTKSDLDYVLENGDCLYKSLNTNLTLNVDDIPRNVTIEGCSLKVILLENETGVMNTTDELNFLKTSFQTKTNTGTGAIFFINGYTFALIWHKLGIFLCDSHSRNEEGFITSDGASVLLKFKTLDDVP